MKYSRLVIVLLVIGIFACTKAEKSSDESKLSVPEKKVQTPQQIFLELDMEELSTSEVGDELPITLRDGSVYLLKIRQMEETMPGIITVSGYINDQETGQATLILRDGKLAGSVNMYSDGINYELGFDEEYNSHYLVPINPDERDVLPGGTTPEIPDGN